MLLLIEDAHWIDPTSLELIELMLEHIGTAPVLVLVTARPSFVAPFRGHPIVTRLALNRLGREATRAIVARITRGRSLPEEVLAEIAARTDGVPLFIEELTKTIVEFGMLRETVDGSARRPAPYAGDSDQPARFADGAARPAAAG